MYLQVLFFAFSLILTLLFFLYGFNHYYLLNAARKYRTPALPEQPMVWPNVSIHLPIYNERYVIDRLLSACAVMTQEYGIDKVRILVIDDSDDDTALEVDKVVDEYKEKHFNIEVMRRENRIGFKAGALQASLNNTDEEFIAIFDADFIPPADFLHRTLPYFTQNNNIGIIQSRWTHLNKDYNLLTEAIAHAIDVHFLVEQPGRYVAGLFQNFNGSGGVLRKKAMLEAGGWRADTLAEDLDLSYRMQLLGYRLLYLRDLLCPGEIPPTVPSFKQQQGRWACGSLRNAKKILPGLLMNRKIGFKQRLQAFIHLTGYMIQPLMVVSFVLSCFGVLLGLNNPHATQINTFIPAINALIATRSVNLIFVQNQIWEFLGPFIALCTIAPWISLISTLKIQNMPVARNLASLMVLLLLGFGTSLSNMREASKALFTNRSWDFTRTPKYAHLQNKHDWQLKKYQIPVDLLWIVELVFVILGIWAIGTAIQYSNFTVLIILVPFTVSYGFVMLFSILQSRNANA